MERLIDKFVEQIQSTEKNFILKHKAKYYFFVQCEVGKARYIYCKSLYQEPNCDTNIKEDLKLAVIVADNIIYILDPFELDVWYVSKDNLPNNTYLFDDFVQKQNDYIKSEVFKDFYNSLETVELEEERIKRCKEEARRILLRSKDKKIRELELTPIFTKQDVANSLCGVLILKKEVLIRLEQEKDKWIKTKSFEIKLQDFINNKEGVEHFELEIAEAINNLNAKMLNIEFELNGKKAVGKIALDTISRKLITRNYFCDYDFDTRINGKVVIKKLNAANYRSDKEREVLDCSRISKITYGRKTLYERTVL